jgi:hypothetical protein
VIGFMLLLALAIGFATVIAAPAVIFAAIIFILAFGAFLVSRGKRRADHEFGRRHGGRDTPTTREAAADPVRDSGVRHVPPRA